VLGIGSDSEMAGKLLKTLKMDSAIRGSEPRGKEIQSSECSAINYLRPSRRIHASGACEAGGPKSLEGDEAVKERKSCAKAQLRF
jgi:hypothetical protein